MPDELAFNSKTDLWLLTLLLTVVTGCLWGIAVIWDSGSASFWLFAPLLAIGIVLPIWIIVSLRYFLSDELLRVRCGPFRWRIPVDRIESVTPVTDARSSPAMSFDRLRIDYGDGRSVMIAPEPRREFLRQLEHRRARTG